MALWDSVKKGAEEGLEALKEGVAVFMVEADRKSKILRKKVELSSLQSQVRSTFTRLGSLVYELYTRGEKDVFGQKDVQDLINRVEGYKTRVREIEKEIEAIKKEERLKALAAKEKEKEEPPPSAAPKD
jgi:hypothetical protein